MLTVLGEAERFGAVCANGARGRRAARGGRAARPASRVARRARAASEFEIRADNVVNATGVWADRHAPRASCTTRPRCRSIRPSRGTHILIDRASALPMTRRRDRPGRRRAARSSCCPWLGQTLIGTTDNDYEGDLDHVAPGRGGRRVPARRGQRVLRHRARPRRPRRRLRRRAAADLHRRPEEVGRHLAQGRALRDLERDDHDHRRQAHDLAADGEDGRRPDRRARRPRGALPHARDPARAWRSTPDDLPRVDGRRRGRRTRSSPAATATSPTRCWRSPASAPSSPQPIVAGQPDLLAEAVVRRAGASRRARVGDVLLRRTRLGLTAARAAAGARRAAPERVAAAMGAELGWDEARCAREAERFRAEAVTEGLVVGTGTAVGPAP